MAPTNQQSKSAKTKLLSGGKAPKARVSRYLKSTEPQLVEGAKSSLLLRGIRCSDSMTTVLKDMRAMKSPHAKMLQKNNVIVPFDDEGQRSLEFLTTKNDCALFAMASHNKKRPNNLVLGRTFDRQILDIAELGVLTYRGLGDFPGAPKKRIGSKPMMLFAGSVWDNSSEYGRLRNLLLDFYRGDPVDKLVLSGLDHMMVFTAVEDAYTVGLEPKPLIHQRTYHIKLKKDPAGGKAPAPYLTPSGPDMDFVLRRTQFALPAIYKVALKGPSSGVGKKKKKVKNQSTNIFGETVGRLHIERQDVDNRGGKKVKALRVAEKIEKAEERRATEQELDKEKEESGQEFKRDFGFEE